MHRRIGFMLVAVVLTMVTLLGAVATAASHPDTEFPTPDLSPPIIWQAIDSDQVSQPGQLPRSSAAMTFTTIITVNTTTDPSKTSLNFTCAYTSGALFFVSSDGLCSFRRALLEASNRPPEDRPILVAFDLSTQDANYDSDTDTWSVMIESGGNLLEIDPRFIVEPDGSVTVDGSTQPGGRTTGPKIIINSNTSLRVSSNNNVLRNLAFQGDGNVIIQETQNVGNHNTIEHVWVGLNAAGDDIYYQKNLGGTPIGLYNGRIRIEQSDNNTIQYNKVAGSNNDEGISVQGSLNVIQYNTVGLRADGTVPQIATKCNFSSFFDPTINWYGGGGITVSGSFNDILNNTVAGMFNVGGGAPARPPAIRLLGSENEVLNNTIGRDLSDYDAGVCGLAIHVAGNAHDIMDNLIVDGGIAETGSGFTEGSIYINESRFMLNQLTIQNNIVRDGQGLVIEYGPAVNMTDPLRIFMPAEVTSINGTSVSGTNGTYVDPITEVETVNVCPNCTIDLYVDDFDNLQEALEFIGTTTTDANGDWTATLNRPLAENEGLRTQSTTQSSGTITNYGPKTSTAFSELYVAPKDIAMIIPSPIYANTGYTFTIGVSPTQTTAPIDYTVEGTDKTTLSATLDSTVISVSNYGWTTAGMKQMTIKAENAFGMVSKVYDVEVLEDVQATFIIGSGGGTQDFDTQDGLSTSVNVPAGAVSGDTTFTYSETDLPAESTSGFNLGGRAFSLVASQSLGGSQINLTLEYDEADLGGRSEDSLVLYYWNTDVSPAAWTDVVDACPAGAMYQRDTVANTITAPICHLSDFFLGTPSNTGGGPSTDEFLYLPAVVR
ncbi:MAG: hypothetical protein AAF629_01800 [Chloroflexota bacterium]